MAIIILFVLVKVCRFHCCGCGDLFCRQGSVSLREKRWKTSALVPRIETYSLRSVALAVCRLMRL